MDDLLDMIAADESPSQISDKIKELINKSADDDIDSSIKYSESARRSPTDPNTDKNSEKYADKIEVLEYWGNFKFQKRGPTKPALIVIALIENDDTTDKLLLRLDTNPLKFQFKPFLISNDYQIEGCPYGYGELDHIKGLIHESTALRNARLDVANLSLNRVWLVERQAGINLRELYTAPNKIILTNDLSGVKPLDLAGVTPSSVNELARIDFDIQNTTEIINPRQDVSNVGAAFGGTATGVNFLSAKTNLRLLNKARLQEELFFKPLAQMLNWYNADLITNTTYYRVRGEDGKNPYNTITPDAFLTPVDFKPTSNPQKLSTAEKKENMAYLLQTVAQIEKVAPGTNDLTELLKIVYKLSGFPHPEKYVKPQQTTILQAPNGQLVDQKGQPINVIPVDEQGQPLPPPEMSPPPNTGGF